MTAGQFLKDRIGYLLALAVSDGLAVFFLWILGLRPIFLLFLAVMWLLPFFIAFLVEYVQKYSYYKQMMQALEALEEKTFLSEVLPDPEFMEGRCMQEILKVTDRYANNRIGAYERTVRAYKEYIELWIHEIKVPITAAQLQLANHREPWVRQTQLDLDRVNAYVEQVLYYARSTSLEKDFFVKRVSLQELVENTLKNCAREMIRGRVTVNLEHLEPEVHADPKWMQFILHQIITNSIKYRSGETLQLTFSGRKEENAVCLDIADNGIGIPENDLERIFEKGFTGQNGRTTAKATGMGLYLCKKLCAKMNLRIYVTSGAGTCMTIVFPVNSMIEGVIF